MSARARLAAVCLATMVTAAGCVPKTSTIGGHDAEEIAVWADEAQEQCVQRTGRKPPHRFTTDGCTLARDGPWQSCCVAHDMAYWCGGSAEQRQGADEDFRQCVGDIGGAKRATVMYGVVRLAGHPWLPVPWRWGYGWAWPRNYTEPARGP